MREKEYRSNSILITLLYFGDVSHLWYGGLQIQKREEGMTVG